MKDFNDVLINALRQNGLELFCEGDLPRLFSEFADEVITVNKSMNLTAITDPLGFAVRHIADSLTVSRFIPQNASVIDVGCGAGFPSVPLAIARPDIKITALDSTAKRIAFIASSAEKLGIKNITAVAARAEDAARGELRGSFDCAVSRAVARLNILSELCIPFIKAGGIFAAMKGDSGEEELKEAEKGIATLGGGNISCHSFFLLGEAEEQKRVIVTAEKLSDTDGKYPRDFSRIKKKPL
ncbi:MAG: 16S rRNA (guanine(527)-N(7))-methyltransferase RsmG [Clostridia bacterium]|nr:16S rRNA (guanine(527)-N(7))-methyltransferase RsmG [Clostridia bacterium]